MKVNVLQEDIDKGSPGDSEFCAINLAVRRAAKTDDVRVQAVEIRIGGEVFAAKDPGLLEDVIYTYDMYGNMKPFSFEIEMKED